MNVPLMPALALVSVVFYVSSTQREHEFTITDAQVEGYSSASIIESSRDHSELNFAFRAARGDGMTTGGVQLHGELRPGVLDEADIHVTQQWRPHIGAWSGSQDAQRVAAQVEQLGDGSMRVSYVAYFSDTMSSGAFVVAPQLSGK